MGAFISCSQLLYCLLILLLATRCRPFNLDVRHHVVFSEPDFARGGYFGFAVGLLSNDEGHWGLVTAPKAKSYHAPRVQNPGTLFKCPLDGMPRNCSEVKLDEAMNQRHDNPNVDLTYHSRRDDGWLGVTLDISKRDSNVVVCGHLWKNQLYDRHYFANGICYLTTKSLSFEKTHKMLPMIHSKYQLRNFTGYGLVSYFSQGQFGMSSTFDPEGNHLLIGAPGFFDAKGTVVEYKNPYDPLDLDDPIIPNPPYYQEEFTRNNYIGYSVTSGKFFKTGEVSIATGAPRDSQARGRVYVFDVLDPRSTHIIPRFLREGIQLGEYFGAALTATDVNNDGFADLLVGSPFFSSNSGGDEGKVTIFLSTGMGLKNADEEIYGSNIPGARFGTALSSLGDLNKDGFNDVAVGAPYEGNGAVYIYHGSAEGLKSEYSQKILASEILRAPLSGFGISISSGKDMDGNDYNDIIIGAHNSGHAVYLRSRPVITVQGRITFKPSVIDIASQSCTRPDGRPAVCFNATYCLRYNGQSVPISTQMDTLFEADIGRKSIPRGVFFQDGRYTPVIRLQKITFRHSVWKCTEEIVYIDPTNKDYRSPMVFKATYNVPDSGTFCKTCPVLDPNVPNSVTREVYFLGRCGHDRVCTSDLELKAHIVNYTEGDILILGQNKSLTISVTVKNLGQDPAFQSRVEVDFPNVVGIINPGRCRKLETLSPSKSTLLCTTGNPLPHGARTDFDFKLDVSKLTLQDGLERRITIYLKALTTSIDSDDSNDKVDLRAVFSSLAMIKITGFPDQEQILLKKDSKKEIIPITHTYKVIKYFASPIQSVAVTLAIPIHLLEYSVPFLSLTDVQVVNGKGDTVAGHCNISIDRGGKGPERGDITIHVDDMDAKIAGLFEDESFENKPNQHQHISLGCSNTKCHSVTCEVGPFEGQRTTATIQMSARVNVTALQKAVGPRDSIYLYSRGYAKILDELEGDIDTFRKRIDATKVKTMFVRAGAPPVESIVGWKLYLSILIGALILIVILVLLYKCGFFKRQSPEEKEKMMQQASLLQEDGAEPQTNGTASQA